MRGRVVARLLDVAQRERDHDDADREVDPEDAAPSDGLDQESAERRADRVRSMPAIAAQMPIARAFAAGSGNAALTSASDVTFTVAAAAPWMPRATLRTSIEGASPQATDAAVNTITPAT